MDDLVPIVDILDELKRLEHGECIWCELGINHPPYSLCGKRLGDRAVPGVATAEPEPLVEAKATTGAMQWGEISRFGERNEFSLRVANSEEDRLKCWHLVYEEYVARGYMQTQELEYRYSLHDALPDTATFLIEAFGKPVGTVTVFPDSPLGLPADEMYKEEIDALRKTGRKPVEVGRLTICKEYMNERKVLMALFDILSIHARCVMKASDLVITVNPTHEMFYARMILFDRLAGQRDMGSVCGAPAVLMRLNLALEEGVRRHAHGEGPKPEEYTGSRTMYAYVSSLPEEKEKVARLMRSFRKPDEKFLKRYFAWVKPLIPQLPSSLQYFFEKCYPGYDLRGQ